jgi:hypothetical protein
MMAERGFMNLYGSIVKGVAQMVTTTKNNLNVENTATVVGTTVRVTRESWKAGVEIANTPRAQRTVTTASKIDSLIADIKKKGGAAKKAYMAAAVMK